LSGTPFFGPPTGCILFEAGEFTRIDPEQTTCVLIILNIGKSYATGIDCLKESTIDVANFKAKPRDIPVQHILFCCGIVLLVENSAQIGVDRSMQIPIILFAGMCFPAG
jgi:hypothetical protein